MRAEWRVGILRFGVGDRGDQGDWDVMEAAGRGGGGGRKGGRKGGREEGRKGYCFDLSSSFPRLDLYKSAICNYKLYSERTEESRHHATIRQNLSHDTHTQGT